MATSSPDPRMHSKANPTRAPTPRRRSRMLQLVWHEQCPQSGKCNRNDNINLGEALAQAWYKIVQVARMTSAGGPARTPSSGNKPHARKVGGG